eukprot:XP_001704440.1 Hypothetical protein GL50803_23863 [Giardia lamblia ATCC 50803]
MYNWDFQVAQIAKLSDNCVNLKCLTFLLGFEKAMKAELL